jgi:ABC-type Na+ efflux pump permease subunit
VKNIIALILSVAVVSAIYTYFAYERWFAHRAVQIGFVLSYFFLGLLGVSTTAASSVTSEKEARTWPILLTTPLDDRQIVWAKMMGAARQYWVIWALLAGHLILFTLAGCIHPVATLLLLVVVPASVLLVAAVGVCFSCCCRRTSVASTINSACFIAFAVPFCCPLPTFLFSPFVATAAILGFFGGSQRTPGAVGAARHNVTFFSSDDSLTAILVLAGLLGLYLLIASLAFDIGRRNVRRRIF